MTGLQRAWKADELFDIRTRFISGSTQTQLSKEYDTTQKTISKIVNMETYRFTGVPDNYVNDFYKRTGKPLYPDVY